MRGGKMNRRNTTKFLGKLLEDNNELKKDCLQK